MDLPCLAPQPMLTSSQLHTLTFSLGYQRAGPWSQKTLDSNRLREAPGCTKRQENCSVFIRKETKKGGGVNLILNDPSTVIQAELGLSGH